MKRTDCRIGMEVMGNGKNCYAPKVKGIIIEIDNSCREDVMCVRVKWDNPAKNEWWVTPKYITPIAKVTKKTDDRKEKKTMNKMVLGWARKMAEQANSDKRIGITFDGYLTTAVDTATGRKETAYCMESDRETFDVAIGIAVAYAKIKGYEIPPALRPTEKKTTLSMEITVKDVTETTAKGLVEDIKIMTNGMTREIYAEIEEN